MSNEARQRQQIVTRHRQFTDALGPHDGLNWFSTGLSLDDAKRLSKTGFGKQLMQFDAADELSAFDFAGVCQMNPAELSAWGVPEPDRTSESNGRGLSYWRAATVAQWAAAGCPAQLNGPPRQKLLAMVGADGPPKLREKAPVERIADAIKLPG